MNILFLTMSQNTDVNTRGIYSDLLRKFRNEGHNVYIVGPVDRRKGIPTTLNEDGKVHLLLVKTLNLQKSSIIEKGLGQLSIEYLYKRNINKYFGEIKFDIILYSTPPITFCNLIEKLKSKNPQAISYLLLKDIFPQNAIDLGILKTEGIKGLIYKYFRSKEKKLYRISDHIGCMSPANIKYVIKHNPEIDTAKVEEAPNTYEISEVKPMGETEKKSIRRKYKLPEDKTVFLYGGNLGKPQGISFLLKVLKENSNREDCHFLIVGSGTEAHLLHEWYDSVKPTNITVLDALPLEDYHKVVRSCDIGMIFLDHRFTIPNFPSRALDYMRYSMPMLVASDPVCDMGPIAQDNDFGFYCESDDANKFTDCINLMLNNDYIAMGEKAYNYLVKNYPIDRTYNAIMRHCK